MKKQLFIIFLVIPFLLGGCGLFGNSADEPNEFNIGIDKEVLRENSAITITAENFMSNNIYLFISRTGDPHIEKRIDGDWARVEEEPPSFDIDTFTLEPGGQRIREISYDFIHRITETTPGEYRVYYDYFVEDEEGETQTQHSDTFTVE
ncbi:MAG: immunoglobulin-like domain-containing protein [Balneolales bacterium]